ncbi:MAG: Glutamate-cysteine ligase family [Proteobacteria bacterium]|nr:Glutamate-cysteine ligase family [Pseudomonadota bacterium]
MRCGIEFEYLMVDIAGPEAGRIRDFSNLPFPWISAVLADKPGCDDPTLATGDLGIKRGYWYLEGDERFHADGRFRTLEVKGVEIRTPPATSVDDALAKLLEIESQLAVRLGENGLGLGIVGFNPERPRYDFTPPLNPWEQQLRQAHRAYDGSQVSTLSYGPDINLSMPGWTAEQALQASRKLNHYAPYILPFSFSSPFYAGRRWTGSSKRTFERAGRRPTVKLFLDDAALARLAPTSRLVHPARLAVEAGRIEFKAFDAQPSFALLAACCHLLEGICRSDELGEQLGKHSEHIDIALYQRAAQAGFADNEISRVAGQVLAHAKAALEQAGKPAAAAALAPLEALLEERLTPAHALLASHRQGGPMYKPGGLAADSPAFPFFTEPLCEHA